MTASKKVAKRAASQAQDDTTATTIPINEQTIDLPTGDGTEAGVMQAANANIELRKALRAKRRAAIKEANFLRTMN
jgi:large subunit ribosomal protein L54